MPDRLRILNVTPYFPAPPRHGGQTLVFHRIKALSAHADIDLVAPAPERADEQDSARAMLAPHCRRILTGAPQPSPSRLHQAWLHVHGSFSGLSAAGLMARRGGLVESFARALETGTYDLILLDHIYLVELLRAPLAAHARIPVIVAEQNVEHIVARDMGRDAYSPAWRRALWAIQSRALMTLERRHYPRVAAIIHISQVDADRMCAAVPGAFIHVAPPMVALPARHKSDYAARGVICFFATLGYFPNAEGLTWFCREVWPLVLRRHPACTLRVIGQPPPALAPLVAHTPNARWLGPLQHEEADRQVLESDLVISPIRFGSGIKMKNLVAMGMGLPVVATSPSFAGLAARPGAEALCADTPAAMADVISALLADEHRRQSLGTSARTYVTQHHTGAEPAARWLNTLKTIAEGNP